MNENAGWQSTATIDDETAITLFHQINYDVVVLLNDLGSESVNKLTSVFSFKNPDLIILKDIGDSTKILEDKINRGLKMKKKPVNIIDDAFKGQQEETTTG
jgi:S-adenosylhomocysteine hydrolase